MNISPTNSTSFGKLVIYDPERAKEDISRFAQTPKLYSLYEDTFDKLDKMTGDDILYLDTFVTTPVSESDVPKLTVRLSDSIGVFSSKNILRQDCVCGPMTSKFLDKLCDLNGFRLSDKSYSKLVDKYAPKNN